FRTLVTLSRGGIFAAIIALAAFLVVYFGYVNRRRRKELMMQFGLFCFGIFAIWAYTSTQTGGMLDKRYSNEDALGREKEDVTTGRGGLFMNEIEGFMSSPIFGIGSSRAKDQRIEIGGQGNISHNE